MLLLEVAGQQWLTKLKNLTLYTNAGLRQSYNLRSLWNRAGKSSILFILRKYVVAFSTFFTFKWLWEGRQ